MFKKIKSIQDNFKSTIEQKYKYGTSKPIFCYQSTTEHHTRVGLLIKADLINRNPMYKYQVTAFAIYQGGMFRKRSVQYLCAEIKIFLTSQKA